MHKIFEESPSLITDYEKVALATEKDYPLHFCATRWMENAGVAKKASNIWSRDVTIVEYWNAFQNTSNREKMIQGQIKITKVCYRIIPILWFPYIFNVFKL